MNFLTFSLSLESTFQGSKYALINKISTERIRRMSIIWNFLNAENLVSGRISVNLFLKKWQE